MKKTWLVAVALLGSSAYAGAFDDYFDAIRFDRPQVLVQLAQKGFDLNTRDEHFDPPIHQALKQNSTQTALMLAAREDVDINAYNPNGETALMLAAIRGDEAVFKAILARDPVINTGGWTVMHYVMSNPSEVGLRMAKALLALEPDVDAPSPNRSTPLMMAAKYGSVEQVKWLLEHGADPTVRNEQGLSAMDFAKASDRGPHRALIQAFLRGWTP